MTNRRNRCPHPFLTGHFCLVNYTDQTISEIPYGIYSHAFFHLRNSKTGFFNDNGG